MHRSCSLVALAACAIALPAAAHAQAPAPGCDPAWTQPAPGTGPEWSPQPAWPEQPVPVPEPPAPGTGPEWQGGGACSDAPPRPTPIQETPLSRTVALVFGLLGRG